MEYGNGPRATPSVYEGLVYTLGTKAHFLCLSATTGDVIWKKDPIADLKAETPRYIASAAPLVEGDLVIVSLGAKPYETVMAFDRRTGEERWRALSDRPGYSAPIVFDMAGKRQLILWTGENVNSLDATTGNLLWQIPYKVQFDPAQSAATPVLHQGKLLCLAAWNRGSIMIQLNAEKPEASVFWKTRQYPTASVNTPVFRDEKYIYTIVGDGNELIDDVHGYDFLNDHNDPSDDNLHGTHVSGTIAAAVNGSGMQGVAYGAKILPLKFLGADGWGYLDDAVRAVNYSTLLKQQGVNVTAINASFSGGGYSQIFYDAIQSAGANGIVFVAAAGNGINGFGVDLNQYEVYPARYDLPNVVSVAATNQDDMLTTFSNFGSGVDIAAPGYGIQSTMPGGGYASLDGTSMAAPHVAGAVAMIKAANPGFTMTQAIDALFSSADVVAGLNVQGGRRLNLAKAVGAAPSVPAPTAPGNLRVTDVWQKAADVRWNDSQNETGYRVELAEGNGAFRTVTTLPANAGRYRVNELTSGRTYTVRITAINNTGSAFAVVRFTTAATSPSAPVSLRTTNIWATKADLAWNLTSQNHSEVRIWKMNARGRWELVSTLAAGATSFRLTGLLANSQTRIRISVWNSAGEAFSNEISFKTKAA